MDKTKHLQGKLSELTNAAQMKMRRGVCILRNEFAPRVCVKSDKSRVQQQGPAAPAASSSGAAARFCDAHEIWAREKKEVKWRCQNCGSARIPRI